MERDPSTPAPRVHADGCAQWCRNDDTATQRDDPPPHRGELPAAKFGLGGREQRQAISSRKTRASGLVLGSAKSRLEILFIATIWNVFPTKNLRFDFYFLRLSRICKNARCAGKFVLAFSSDSIVSNLFRLVAPMFDSGLIPTSGDTSRTTNKSGSGANVSFAAKIDSTLAPCAP